MSLLSFEGVNVRSRLYSSKSSVEVLKASYSSKSSFRADSLNTISQSAPIAPNSTSPETTAIIGVEETLPEPALGIITPHGIMGAVFQVSLVLVSGLSNVLQRLLHKP